MTRYRMVRLIGFAWNKIAGDVVSAFESTGIYPLNRNRVPEYLFSNFDTSETITSIATTPPNMALVLCALYFSNQLSSSAEPSFSTLNNILHSDTSFEELTCFRLFKSCPVPKIPRKYSIGQIFFITEEAT